MTDSRIPEWAQKISLHEYGDNREIPEILGTNPEGKDFSDFYENEIGGADTKSAPDNEAETMGNFQKGDPINCEVAATAGGLAAEILEEDLEVYTEWEFHSNVRNRGTKFTGEPTVRARHVALVDDEDNVYGGRRGYEQNQRTSIETLAGIYLAANDSEIQPDFSEKSQYSGLRK